MPSILVEAVSTNTKIISTDCKHGPNELLKEFGEESHLIEVNNENQLLKAINKFSSSKKFKELELHLEDFI